MQVTRPAIETYKETKSLLTNFTLSDHSAVLALETMIVSAAWLAVYFHRFATSDLR